MKAAAVAGVLLMVSLLTSCATLPVQNTAIPAPPPVEEEVEEHDCTDTIIIMPMLPRPGKVYPRWA